MTFAFGFDATVSRPTGTDRYGNPLTPITFVLVSCAAAPVGSVESLNGQAQVLDEDTLYVDYDADVRPGDSITIPAGTPLPPGRYEVNGRPQRWQNPFTGTQSGAVVRLQRVSG